MHTLCNAKHAITVFIIFDMDLEFRKCNLWNLAFNRPNARSITARLLDNKQLKRCCSLVNTPSFLYGVNSQRLHGYPPSPIKFYHP